MKSTTYSLAITLLVLSPTATAVTTALASKINCTEAHKTARVLNSSQWNSITDVPDYDLSKDEYEKTEDYKKRLATRNETALRQAKESVMQFTDGAPVQYRRNISPREVAYDADTERLKVAAPINSHTTIERFSGAKKYVTLSESDGNEKVEPYILGTKKVSDADFGVAFSTKLKISHQWSGNTLVRMKPEQAVRVRDHLAFSIAGPLSTPYKITKYYNRDNLDKLEIRRTTSRYFVMDAPCVAIIDRRSGEVVFDYK